MVEQVSEETLEQFWLDIRGIKGTDENIYLSELQAQQILASIGIEGEVMVTVVHEYNHVYRIQCDDEILFLKIFTKGWYTQPHEGAYCVEHERSAWHILKAHNIATPDVLITSQDANNPLGLPFVLTRRVQGEPLDILLRYASQSEIHAQLLAVGSYMRQMHSITFRYPGYLIGDNGPTGPLAEDEWQHGIWTAQQCQQDLFTWIQSIRPTISEETAQRLEQRLATAAQELALEYEPLRFVHGDCHLEQIFLQQEGEQWHVQGVVDMEMASSGASTADLAYVCRELAQCLAPQTRWWESFFAGYGSAPDFERFRLRLLNCWYPYGANAWPGSGDTGFNHLLTAQNWGELFSDAHLDAK